MYDFMLSLINYLKANICNDIDVKLAFPQNAYKPPVISLQIADHSDYVSATDYMGANATSISLQIDVHTKAMTIDNVSCNAQMASIKIADKVEKLLRGNLFAENVPDLLASTKAGGNFGIPIDKGNTTYATILRYDLIINKGE